MASKEIADLAARNALRKHQTELTEAIEDILRDITTSCEEEDLIVSKDKILSDAIGKTEGDRASMLVDNIKRSLAFDAESKLDAFLCILYKKGRKDVSVAVAKEYGDPLPKFSLISGLSKTHVSPLCNTEDTTGWRGDTGSSQLKGKRRKGERRKGKQWKNENDSTGDTGGSQWRSKRRKNESASEPEVKNLVVALKDFLNWEEFGLQLPGINQPDINRIKIENNGIEAQKRALFYKWLCVDQDASWTAVVNALKLTNETVLAQEISEQFLGIIEQHSTEPTVSTPIQLGVAGTSPLSIETDGQPNPDLDSKKLYSKSPVLEDVLEVVPLECDCEGLRKALNVTTKGADLREVISMWINEETSDVTWKHLLQSLKDCNHKPTARLIATQYLRRPSVYHRYINKIDFESMDDLGL